MNWLGSAKGIGPTPVIRIDPSPGDATNQIPAGTRLKALGRNASGAVVYDIAAEGEDYDAWFYGRTEDPSRGYAVERSTSATLAEPYEQEKR